MNMTQFMMVLFYGIVSSLLYLMREKTSYNSKKSMIVATISTLFACFLGFITFDMTKGKFSVLSNILAAITNFYFSYNLALGKIKVKTFIKSTGVVFLFLTSSIFQLIPIFLFNISGDVTTTKLNIYLTVFSDIALLIVLLLLYYNDLKKAILKAKENFNEFFDTSFRIWLFGFLGMVISNLIIGLVFPSATAGNENAVQSMIDVSPIIMLICAGIVAPINEELTFRKAFKDVFKNKWIFILVSGVIFGGLHVIFSYESLIDFIYIIPYSLLGISFAYMVDKTNNILSSIMMHFIHNSAIIVFSILMGMIIL